MYLQNASIFPLLNIEGTRNKRILYRGVHNMDSIQYELSRIILHGIFGSIKRTSTREVKKLKLYQSIFFWFKWSISCAPDLISFKRHWYVQVAIGSIQILQANPGRIKSGSKIGDTTELDTSGPEFSMASDIGQSILGILKLVLSHVELSFKSSPVLFSWIAGIIQYNNNYCHNDIYSYWYVHDQYVERNTRTIL